MRGYLRLIYHYSLIPILLPPAEIGHESECYAYGGEIAGVAGAHEWLAFPNNMLFGINIVYRCFKERAQHPYAAGVTVAKNNPATCIFADEQIVVIRRQEITFIIGGGHKDGKIHTGICIKT